MEKQHRMAGQYVVITTTWRGVFCGKLVEYCRPNGSVETGVAVLEDVRHCVYWSPNVRGVTGLASNGPDSDCRISRDFQDEATCEFAGVTAIFACTETAVTNWKKSPWS